MLKLIIMPAVGLGVFLWQKLPSAVYAPGLILPATPSATAIGVMARKMGGDPDLAVAAISFAKLSSAGTMTLRLHIGMG